MPHTVILGACTPADSAARLKMINMAVPYFFTTAGPPSRKDAGHACAGYWQSF